MYVSASAASAAATTAAPAAPVTPARLADTVRAFAARTELWRPMVRYTSPDRWYQRLERGEGYEVWLLSWLPGQGTEIHDHGGSSGAFGVVAGLLTERTFAAAPRGGGPRTRVLREGREGGVRAFGPRHIHEVTNLGARPAVSIHAYAPALATMSYYRQGHDGRLLLVRTEDIDEGGE